MRSFDYVEPETLEEVVARLAEYGDEAHLLAGGTSMVLMLNQGLVQPRVMVGLRRIGALRGVRRTEGGGLSLGALTTHREVELSEDARHHERMLPESFARIATIRIRNQATLGGNLAHADPAQDPPPVLMVLDATVVVVGPDGERRIPIGELFVDFFETSMARGEVITGAELPARPAGSVAAYEKFLPRTEDDYATVAVAASTRLDDGVWRDVRIALGAAGPVPMRATAAERELEGRPVDEQRIASAAARAAEAADPLDDLRGSAGYKRAMVEVWTRRVLGRLAEGEVS